MTAAFLVAPPPADPARDARPDRDRRGDADGDDTPTSVEDGWPRGWLREKLIAVAALDYLEEGWDSYGAAAVDSASVAWASEHLRQLATGREKTAPAVSASPDGLVLLTWTWGDDRFESSWTCLPDGDIRFDFEDDENPTDDPPRVGRWVNALEVLPCNISPARLAVPR